MNGNSVLKFFACPSSVSESVDPSSPPSLSGSSEDLSNGVSPFDFVRVIDDGVTALVVSTVVVVAVGVVSVWGVIDSSSLCFFALGGVVVDGVTAADVFSFSEAVVVAVGRVPPVVPGVVNAATGGSLVVAASKSGVGNGTLGGLLRGVLVDGLFPCWSGVVSAFRDLVRLAGDDGGDVIGLVVHFDGDFCLPFGVVGGLLGEVDDVSPSPVPISLLLVPTICFL